MRPWAPPEELLRTTSALPGDMFESVAFEYVYDGGDYEGVVATLRKELSMERNKTKRLNIIVNEVSTELEALIERNQRDLGALTAEYRYKEDRYEGLIAQLRSDLSDAKAQCVDLTSKLSAEREAYFAMQKQLYAESMAHAELSTQLEHERSLNIRLREDNAKRVAELTAINKKLEARAQAAENEASASAIELRECKIRFALDRSQFGANAIIAFFSRRRVRDLKRGLMRWKLMTRNEKARLDYQALVNEMRCKLRGEFDDELEIVTGPLKSEIGNQRRYIERLEASRDRIAEAQFRVLDPAKNLTKPYTMARWKLVYREAQMNKLKATIAAMQKDSGQVGEALIRARSCVAHALVNQSQRLQRWFVHRAFALWKALAHQSNLLALNDCMREAWDEVKATSRALKKTRLSAAQIIANARNRCVVNRVFDTWRLQLEERKLRRVSEWPQLWRLAHMPTAPITHAVISSSANTTSSSIDGALRSSGSIIEEGNTTPAPSDSAVAGGITIPPSQYRWGIVESGTPRKSVRFEPMPEPYFLHLPAAASSSSSSSSSSSMVISAITSTSAPTTSTSSTSTGAVVESIHTAPLTSEVVAPTRAALAAALHTSTDTVPLTQPRDGIEANKSSSSTSGLNINTTSSSSNAVEDYYDYVDKEEEAEYSPVPYGTAPVPSAVAASEPPLSALPVAVGTSTLTNSSSINNNGDDSDSVERRPRPIDSDSDDEEDDKRYITIPKESASIPLGSRQYTAFSSSTSTASKSSMSSNIAAHPSAPTVTSSLDAAIARAKHSIDSPPRTRDVMAASLDSHHLSISGRTGMPQPPPPRSPDAHTSSRSAFILKMMNSPTYEAWAESVVKKKLEAAKI